MYSILFIHELFIHIVLSNQRIERFQTNFDQLEFSIHSNEILVNWSRMRAYRRKIIGCFNLHEFLSLTIEEENESTSILPFLIPTLRIFNQTLSSWKIINLSHVYFVRQKFEYFCYPLQVQSCFKKFCANRNVFISCIFQSQSVVARKFCRDRKVFILRRFYVDRNTFIIIEYHGKFCYAKIV